jgi:hypothetical protein
MTLPHSETEGLPRYDTQPCPGPGPHGVTGDCPVCAGLGVVPAAALSRQATVAGSSSCTTRRASVARSRPPLRERRLLRYKGSG